MADFNSKYTGEQVEALLDIVSEGGVGGGGEGEVQKTTEAEITAMGFTKNLGTITEVKMNGVSKGTSGVVDLGTVITEHQDISGKQDKITDLDTIRSGAEKGATALQSVPSEYVTEKELTNKGYATTTQLADKVDKVSGKQLSTEDFTTALKTKLEGLSNYDDTEIENAVSSLQTQFNTLVSGNASEAINSFNEIIAFLNGIEDSESLDSIIASIEQQIAGKMDKVTLATVATSGSYNDLSNKPTIPSAVTESTVSGWGFTKNTGTYSKPSGGIPKTDLASAVQTSLGKADTALQSYTEQYKGTVTKVKINGSEKSPDSDGVVDLGTIESGGSSSSGGGKVYITLERITSYGLYNDNTVYVATTPQQYLTLSLNNFAEPTNGLCGEYTMLFSTGQNNTLPNEPGYVESPPLTVPSEFLWPNGFVPTFEFNTTYELSVVATKLDDDYVYKAVLTPFKTVE